MGSAVPDDDVADEVEPEAVDEVDQEDEELEERPALTRDDLDDGPNPTSGKVRVVLLVVAAIVAGFLIAQFLGSGDDDGGGDGGDGGAAVPDEGVPFPTGDQNRTGYWGFVNLSPIVVDTFDRANDPQSLGDAGDGGTWDPVAGTWGIRDDAAVTAGGDGEGPFLAVVPGGGRGDGLTEVTMTVVEEGAGLVFRYLDPENYWSITANPGVGTWTVNRTIDGDTESAGELLSGPTADDTTVSVEQKGSNLRFMLDGTEYLALTDGALADQLQGGMIAAGTTAGEARWNRFLVMTYGADEAGGATTTTAPA